LAWEPRFEVGFINTLLQRGVDYAEVKSAVSTALVSGIARERR
jgi:hypothetical protein